MKMKTPTLICDDGTEVELPSRWEICGRCRGEGKSSAYLGAFTQSDMDEAGPEFLEDYVSGAYDRACDRCDGTGKVRRVDWSKLTRAQRKAWNEQVRDERDYAAEVEAERRMGC
jgi:hypothetical protein